MNSAINILIRRLLASLKSRPLARLLVVAIALGVAGIGSVTAFWSGTATKPPSVGQAQGSYTLTGRVIQVADGDTFTLLVKRKQQRVRMASIDAPEIGRLPDKPGQPHAQASKKALSALIAGKTLTLNCYERDRYDRNVCDVPLAGGDTANRKQVAAGMAWANMEGRGKFMRDPELPDLEQQARRAAEGIWQQSNSVRPWVWRYQCWQQHQC